MKKTPISLIVDDPAPRVFAFYEHSVTKTVKDGRPIPDNVPNDFLTRFCDVAERYGIRGKYSVVPMPGGRGRIDGEIHGFPKEEISWWIETVKTRLGPLFSFCPEMLTHAGYIDLATGKMMPMQENDWSFTQTEETLVPYISLAFEILKNVGIDSCGVTSPWNFGVKNEDIYARSVSLALKAVTGKTDAWYFCRSLHGQPNARPWVALREEDRRVAAIPGTIPDGFWQTMDTTENSEEYISKIADAYITEDGTAGEILNVLGRNGWPILTTHWQSMFSNGLETGLRALDTVARRVEKHLSDRVEWTRFDDLMRMTLA